MATVNSDDIICSQLDINARSLEKIMDSDVLALDAPLISPIDDYVRKFIELLQQRTPKRNKLAVVLTTTGGYIEIVHRIVDTLRHYYNNVSFVVPNYAYSAGRTETRHIKVTKSMKTDRANKIAQELNKTERWHVHGHGISMEVLRRDDIKLIIDDFGKNKELNIAIREYYNLLDDYTSRSGAQGALHIINTYEPIWQEGSDDDNSD